YLEYLIRLPGLGFLRVRADPGSDHDLTTLLRGQFLSPVPPDQSTDRIALPGQPGPGHHDPPAQRPHETLSRRARGRNPHRRTARLRGLRSPPGFAHPRPARREPDRGREDRRDFFGLWLSADEGCEAARQRRQPRLSRGRAHDPSQDADTVSRAAPEGPTAHVEPAERGGRGPR